LDDGEVLVQCRHIGLCGSNVAPYLADGRWREGPWPRPLGWQGHENVGTVVESRNGAWPAGVQVLGQSRDYNGFVEYLACNPRTIARLPDNGPDLARFVVAQPLATVIRALHRTRPPIHERCAVVGQGPIGLMYTYLLRRMGASQVIGIDLVPWRLAWAKRLGATHVVDARNDNVIQAVRELTHSAMVDLCVEAAGTAESRSTAAFLPRYQGRLLVFGVPHHDAEPFPWYYTTDNETEIVLSRGGNWPDYLPRAIEMVAGTDIMLAEMVTPRLPWGKAPEAFEMYAFPAEYPDSLKVTLDL